MYDTTQFAKFLMRKWVAHPASPEQGIGELAEVFSHPIFVNSSDSQKEAMMLQSSEAKYASEMVYPWDTYFATDLKSFLHDKEVLDLGCFTGGRSVAWFDNYQLKSISGIDVSQTFIDAAQHFADLKGVPGEFKIGTGEDIPFPDASFDAILSFDVLEHVRDFQQALEECYRVLKPGGRLFLVFPSYFQPMEHHLGLATRLPGIQYIFSGRTLVKAYYELLVERGETAEWYRRDSPELANWERGHTINGTTLAQFKRYLKSAKWHVVHQSRKPLGSIGRTIQDKKGLGMVSKLFYPFTFLPGIQEIILHRITYVLETSSSSE